VLCGVYNDIVDILTLKYIHKYFEQQRFMIVIHMIN